MATCRDVITTALRKLKVVYPGRSPSADEASDCLESLQSWYDEMIAAGGFGRLTDVRIADDYEAGENERIFNADDSPYSVSLPETISDGYAEGGYRPPYDRSVVVVAGSTEQAYIYNAPTGSWQALKALTLDSDAPLASRGSDGLASVLAIRVADQFGKQVSNVTAISAARFLTSLSYKLDSAYRPVEATYY